MRRRRGLTLLEGIFLTILVAGACVFLAFVFRETARRREMSRRTRCRSNLNQLAKGMATYLDPGGAGCGPRLFPYPLGRVRNLSDFNGAEWLASLYWTGVVPDPGVFLCPSSGDDNQAGRDLGSSRTCPAFGSQTVSYAGMHYYSGTDDKGNHVGGAIRDDFPPSMPMASDDTQGTINHGTADNGGMCVLFFDSHVDFKTNEEIDVEHGVGDDGSWPKKLLWQLRN